MNRLSRYCFAAVLSLAASWAAFPASAQVVQEYDYEPDRIYPVRTGLGITTQLVLSPYEKILDYSTGFSSGWDLTRRDNVFYLKPKNVDVDTNMVVRTETNSYIFELKVVATDWTALEQAKRDGVHYRIAFRYASDAEFVAKADVTEEAPQASAALDKNRTYNFEYDFAANRSTRNKRAWLIPVNVYDDGRFTYVRMSNLKDIPTGNFPAVFGRERENGEDFMVNTTIEDNTIIVHGIYPYLVIRHGKNAVGLRRSMQK